MEVIFPMAVEDGLLAYAVIAARQGEHWLFVRHRQRHTWEAPGGRREKGETAEQTARRELFEETGATRFSLAPIGPYGVIDQEGSVSYGMLYYAQVEALGPLPPSEIAQVEAMEHPPQDWTYPHIQPILLERARQYLCEGNSAGG